MIKKIVELSKAGAILLLLSLSSHSFASGHGGYIPLAIAAGYIAHKSYHHDNQGHSKHYYGRGYNKHAYYYGHRNRYNSKHYYNNGHRNRYYNNRYYGYKHRSRY